MRGYPVQGDRFGRAARQSRQGGFSGAYVGILGVCGKPHSRNTEWTCSRTVQPSGGRRAWKSNAPLRCDSIPAPSADGLLRTHHALPSAPEAVSVLPPARRTHRNGRMGMRLPVILMLAGSADHHGTLDSPLASRRVLRLATGPFGAVVAIRFRSTAGVWSPSGRAAICSRHESSESPHRAGKAASLASTLSRHWRACAMSQGRRVEAGPSPLRVSRPSLQGVRTQDQSHGRSDRGLALGDWDGVGSGRISRMNVLFAFHNPPKAIVESSLGHAFTVQGSSTRTRAGSSVR